ncbi:MAG: hypothetical protein COT15_01510 [Candidatus Diapherotrites archaeon CG08_land_8_20_14_0_20_34_12]|nr:MAG: hypothetical protein COT15_01510 [Candidatus Diapherotrites archaeon CG08_land_8_20_14_0_20_34_12]
MPKPNRIRFAKARQTGSRNSGRDAIEVLAFASGRGYRKKHLLRKRFFQHTSASESAVARRHKAIFSRLRKLKIPTAKVEGISERKYLFARDLSKGGRTIALDLHFDPDIIQGCVNAESLIKGIARDLAIMHNNGLFILKGRSVTEPWLLYFRSPKHESAHIASRAITDVGAIYYSRKAYADFDSDPMRPNLFRLTEHFPDYRSQIEATYKKYRK